MAKCILPIGQVTYAIKAKKILQNEKIRAETVKLKDKAPDGGCIYGIAIREEDYLRVRQLLTYYGIAAGPLRCG